MNTDLFKQYAFVVIRWVSAYVAAFLSAWLVKKLGVASDAITPDQVSNVIYGGVTFIMFAWSLFNKTRYETKVNTALTLQAGQTKDTLKEIIARGNGSSPLESK